MKRMVYEEIFDYLNAYFKEEHRIIKKNDYNKENIIEFTQTRYCYQFIDEISKIKNGYFKDLKFKDFVFEIKENKVYFQYKS